MDRRIIELQVCKMAKKKPPPPSKFLSCRQISVTSGSKNNAMPNRVDPEKSEYLDTIRLSGTGGAGISDPCGLGIRICWQWMGGWVDGLPGLYEYLFRVTRCQVLSAVLTVCAIKHIWYSKVYYSCRTTRPTRFKVSDLHVANP